MVPKDTVWLKAWDVINSRFFKYDSDVNAIVNWLKEKKYRVKNILDVGCGAGHYSFLLSKKGYSCIGIDKCRETVNYAKCIYPYIEFYNIDLFDLNDFFFEKFDLILGKHLTFSREDILRVLGIAKKCLKPNSNKLIVFDFLLKTGKLKPEFTDFDIICSTDMEGVRINYFILSELENFYIWEEVYFLKEKSSDNLILKTNKRNLYFLQEKELENILELMGIEVEKTTSEEVGIDGLKGVNIYGRFR